MLDASAVGSALTTLAEQSPYGIVLVNADGMIEYANRAMGALLRVPAADLVGQPSDRFAHPADRVAGPLGALRSHRRRRRLVRADGREVVVTILVTPVVDGNAEPVVLAIQTVPDVEEAPCSDDLLPSGAPERATPAGAVEDAAAALTGALTVADVTRVMERQVSAFGASGLLISLANGPRLRLVSHWGYPEDVLEFLVDQPMSQPSPMVDAVRRRKPVFVETFSEYLGAYPARAELAARTGKQAWAFLPMVAGGQVIGSWCLSYDAAHRFTVGERALLATLSGLLAQAVARSEVLEAERSLTRTLQRSLLPATLPEVEGCAIAVRYTPAVAGLEVGGDFYDVVPLPGGGTGIVIGDAQGHSATAAALMGQARAALRAYAAEGHDPATIVARANRFLVTAGGDSFVTCMYAALDATHDGLTIVRAGHPEPILVTPDGAADWLEIPGGLPLGVEARSSYPVTWVPLPVGCRIVFYTDGLVEQRGSGLDIGEEQLLRRTRAGRGLPLETFADAILDPRPAREDDVAVLVLDRVAQDRSAEKRQATFEAASTDRFQIRRLRQSVVDRCRRWGWSHRCDEVELLVSELVTNAMIHVGGDLRVTVTASASQLTVAVSDTSVHAPAPGAGNVWDASGRGLSIVEAVADEWGVDPSGPGKSVWFSLRRGTA